MRTGRVQGNTDPAVSSRSRKQQEHLLGVPLQLIVLVMPLVFVDGRWDESYPVHEDCRLVLAA